MKAVRNAGYLEAENPDNPESRALALLSRKNKKIKTKKEINKQTKYDSNEASIEKPTCASLGINQTIDEMLTSSNSNQLQSAGNSTVGGAAADSSDSDLDLEGIDDDEIERMLLKPPEVKK